MRIYKDVILAKDSTILRNYWNIFLSHPMNIEDISVFLKYKSKWPTMEIHNLLDIKSRTELREWLIHNHKTEKECWIVVKRGRHMSRRNPAV